MLDPHDLQPGSRTVVDTPHVVTRQTTGPGPVTASSNGSTPEVPTKRRANLLVPAAKVAEAAGTTKAAKPQLRARQDVVPWCSKGLMLMDVGWFGPFFKNLSGYSKTHPLHGPLVSTGKSGKAGMFKRTGFLLTLMIPSNFPLRIRPLFLGLGDIGRGTLEFP